jgi:hypothetical protein
MPLILSVFSPERRIEVHSVLKHTITLICWQLLCFASPANVPSITPLEKKEPAMDYENAKWSRPLQFELLFEGCLGLNC